MRSPTREETSKPVVHGDVHVSVGLEHFEKDEICIACVLDIVIGNAWNEAHIIGIEVHGAGPVGGHEYGYAPLAREVKLPLGGIWMPVQLAHASRLDGDQCSATLFEAGKLRESTIRTFPPGCFLGRSHRPILKVYWMGDSTFFLPTAALSCEREKVWKDIEPVFRQLCDSVPIEIEILRQDLMWCVCDPRGDEKGVVFREHAFVKDKQELATIPWPETLNGMRIAGRKEPEVALRSVHAPRRVPNETRESSM